MKVLHGKGEIALLFEGTSINDVRRFSAIFDLPTMFNYVYPITSNIWGLFGAPTYPKNGYHLWTFPYKKFIAPLSNKI